MKTIEEIVKDLSQAFPQYEATREQSGTTLTYIPWYHVNTILDQHAPGWNKDIVKVERFQGRDESGIEDMLMVTVRIVIPYRPEDDAQFVSECRREQVGFERFKERVYDKNLGSYTIKDLAYGDVFSNAMSMALRRAAADFGVGRYLYDKGKGQGASQQPRPAQATPQGVPQQGQAATGQQVKPTNPGATSVDDMVTPRQTVAINAIANSLGREGAAVCAEQFGLDMKAISRRAASWLIDYLKREAGQELGVGR